VSPATERSYNPWAPHPSSFQNAPEQAPTPDNATNSPASPTPSRVNAGSQKRNSRQSANPRTSKKRSGSTAKSQKPTAKTNRRRTRKPRKKRKPSPLSPLLYAIRLAIAGVGLSAIAGTFISFWHPTAEPQLNQQNLAEAQENRQVTGMATPGNWQGNVETSYPQLSLKYELKSVKTKWQGIADNYSRFDVGAFLLDLDTGAYINLNANRQYSAASTIKVPILIAFLQEVDAGNIKLHEKLEMKEKHVAKGSGNLQYQEVGNQYTAWELASKTIAISDNTATNILIDRLGGIEKLNQRFQSWGLQTTRLQNPLPDLEGTNTTNPKELAKLMAWIEQGHMLTLRSRDRLLHLMRQTKTNSLLPQGLPAQASIAHKTGDIGSLLADVGTIDLPNGKRYLLAVMVKRPHNNYVAADIIRKISQTTAKSLNSGEAMSQ
jgi:beta-lactamase class A